MAGGRAVDNPPKCKSTRRKGIKAEQGSAADPTRSRGSRSCGARSGSCPGGALGVVSWPPVPIPALSLIENRKIKLSPVKILIPLLLQTPSPGSAGPSRQPLSPGKDTPPLPSCPARRHQPPPACGHPRRGHSPTKRTMQKAFAKIMLVNPRVPPRVRFFFFPFFKRGEQKKKKIIIIPKESR